MMTIRRAMRFAVLAVVMGIAACSTDSTDAQIQAIVNNVVVDLGLGRLTVGQTLQAQAILHDVAGSAITGVQLTWASSNKQVATVSSDGMITAVSPGTSDITASANGHSAMATLTVVDVGGTGGNPVVTATRVVIIQQPTAAMTGVTITPAPSVELHDATNNRVVGADQLVTASIASGTGTIAGNTAMSVAGIATFSDLRITGTGAFTVVFSAVGLSSATSSSVDITDVLATQLQITTQPPSSSPNGQALGRQPAVQLLDASGDKVARSGVVVTATTDTDATLGGTTTATTDVSGTATFSNLSISGKGGPKKIKFSSPGQSPATSDPVIITPGPAASVSITAQPSSAAQSGVVFPQQPAVQLLDASGNAVTQSGAVISVSVASGSASLGGTATATTNTSGVATFTNLSLSGSGTATLQFASSGLTSATSSAIGVTAGSPSQLSITTQPSANAQAGVIFAQQPVIQLRDAANNAVSQAGVVVSAGILSGGGTLGGTATATTDASGVATFTNLSISGTAGARTLSFGATGFNNVTSSSINVVTGAAATLAITTQPSTTAQVGVPLAQQPVIQLLDASNNSVAQAGVTITASVSTGTLSGTATATTNASGVATFTNLALLGAPGSPTLTFAATGLTSVSSSSITLSVGAASQIVITTQPSSSATSGVAFSAQPVVRLRDVSGNNVSQAAVNITVAVASGTGTLNGTATVATSTSGIATFAGLSITGSGAHTLKFTSTGLTQATSNTITVAATATKLAMSTQPPTSVNSGATFSAAVRLQDASGANLSTSGVSVTVSKASGSGTLGGTLTATTNTSGIATFNTLNITGSGAHTLTFTSGTLTAATSNSITVNTPPPATNLGITTQPSASATSGQAFGQQPVIQLRDASNNPVLQSGVSVTATIASGGGTLGGTATVTTNGSGLATFTNLSITGADGARTLGFTAPALTSATSNSISISAASSGGFYPNRPAAFTSSSELDFSQAVPSLPDDVDRPIAGTDWNMIYFGSDWTKTTDANAPQSAPSIWSGHWAPGSYGGGVIGQGGGHGIGNIFTYGPGNAFLSTGITRVYMSMRLYFDFDPSQWHPISNKFVNITGDHSLFLVQLDEGGNWRHAEELGFTGYPSFGVDNNTSVGDTHLPGQVDNRPVPNRQWVQLEVLIDIPNHIFKVWQDGVLTTNATPTFASTKINTVGINAFRGGGGETLTTDLYYKYDHFFIAW